MRIGGIIFRAIGVFIRWMFNGFKGSFTDAWDGPKTDNFDKAASYGMINISIGFVVLVVFCLLLARIRCN